MGARKAMLKFVQDVVNKDSRASRPSAWQISHVLFS